MLNLRIVPRTGSRNPPIVFPFDLDLQHQAPLSSILGIPASQWHRNHYKAPFHAQYAPHAAKNSSTDPQSPAPSPQPLLATPKTVNHHHNPHRPDPKQPPNPTRPKFQHPVSAPHSIDSPTTPPTSTTPSQTSWQACTESPKSPIFLPLDVSRIPNLITYTSTLRSITATSLSRGPITMRF